MTLPNLTKMEEIFHNKKGPKHFISQVYLTIMEEYPKQNIHQSRERWESDLGIKYMRTCGLACVRIAYSPL